MHREKEKPLECCSRKQKNDKDFVLGVVGQNGIALQHASRELRGNREVVIASIKSDPMALAFASTELKNDLEIVTRAVTTETDHYLDPRPRRSFRYIGNELRNNQKFAIWAVRYYGKWLKFLPRFQNDRTIVRDACRNFGKALKYASNDIKHDKNFVLALLRKNGNCFPFTTDEFRDDREMLLPLIRERVYYYRYISDRLRRDREIIDIVLNKKVSYCFLPWIYKDNPDLKTDIEFALFHAPHLGKNIEYLSAEMRDNYDVVLAAVKADPNSFKFASEGMRSNLEIVIAAALQNENILYDVPSKERCNCTFAREIMWALQKSDLKAFPRSVLDKGFFSITQKSARK